MGRGEGTLYEVVEFGENLRGTLCLTVLIALVYGVQLLLAQSIGPDVAYTTVREYVQPNPGLYLFTSPLVHSSHSHLVWNMAFLLVGGAIVEYRVGWLPTLAFVYGVAVSSNILPPVLGIGGFGIGISGGNAGLWSFFGLLYLTAWSRDGARKKTLDIEVVGHGLLATLGLFYTLIVVLQFTGVLPTQPGVAKGTHLVGAVFGVLWYVYHELDISPTLTEIRPGA